MTEEERQRMMEFILAQQAQFWASVQKHEEWHAKHEAWQNRAEVRIDNGAFRADRLERILKLMIKAGSRTRRQIREQGVEHDRRLAEHDQRSAEHDRLWNERFAELMQAQALSDKKLADLIDVVRQQRNVST